MKNTRKLVLTGIFSAIAFVLMLLEFPLSFLVPGFLKMDFSELPALICSFSAGPVWGVAVCLIKNLLHLPMSATGGVGELANFLLGVAFVFPAGLIYRLNRSRKGALLGMLTGMLAGAILSLPINYYITYPVYMTFMNEEAILTAYRVFVPGIQNLLQALALFNIPFTLAKFLVDAVVTFFLYKRISPLLKGEKKDPDKAGHDSGRR